VLAFDPSKTGRRRPSWIDVSGTRSGKDKFEQSRQGLAAKPNYDIQLAQLRLRVQATKVILERVVR
jgi:hypothetical protein